MPIRTVFFVIIALIIQYIYLQGSLISSPHYPSSKIFSKVYQSQQYIVDEYIVNFDIPATTEVHLTPDKGQEMLFNIYFVDSALSFRGYIQVWIINDLPYFLTNSKSLSPFDFISYSIVNMSNSNYDFQEEWTANFGEKSISALEYWLTINPNNEVLRISFFTDNNDFPADLVSIAQHIVSTIEK